MKRQVGGFLIGIIYPDDGDGADPDRSIYLQSDKTLDDKRISLGKNPSVPSLMMTSVRRQSEGIKERWGGTIERSVNVRGVPFRVKGGNDTLVAVVDSNMIIAE